MIPIYVLSEGSLPGLIWHCLTGRRPMVFDVMPYMRFAGPVLNLATRVLGRLGLLLDPYDLDERLPWCEGWPGRGMYTDAYARIEAELHDALKPCGSPSRLEPYAYALRKAVSWHGDRMARLLMLVEWLDAHPERDWRLIGVPSDFIAAHDWYHARSVRVALRPARPWSRMINTVNGLALLFWGMIWLAVRVRRQVELTDFTLLADGRAPYDVALIPRLVNRPEELAIYHRNAALAHEGTGRWAAYRSFRKEDGRVTLAGLVQGLAEMMLDGFAVWRGWRDRHPALFAMGFAQVVKRQMFRALFNRVRPRFYWARDDYSVDHVVRSQELRRVGGRSLGVNHGLPTATIHHAWREVDFDVYFTFGRHLHQSTYRDSWAPHMKVVPAGNPRLQPSHLRAIAEHGRSRSKDVVFFATVSGHDGDMVREVFELARRLPDRRVLFKMKPARRPREIAEYQRLLRDEAPANVASIEGDAYALMEGHRYVVGGGTTAVAEALQFGCMSFAIDVFPEIANFYYRNFPELCFAGGAAVAEVILAIESGRAAYPFERLGSLIVLPPVDVCDIIRAEMEAAPTPRNERASRP